MFWKIFKHDFVKIYKSMGVYYLLAIIFAVLAKILQDSTATILIIVGNICAGGMWGLSIFSLINGILKAINNFNENIYGDGAFVTRCLPVSMHTIFLEKFCIGALLSLTSIIVATGAAVIVYAPYEEISTILELISSTTNTNGTLAMIFIFAIFYVEILLVFSVGIAGLTFGHKHIKNKNLYSVMYGLIFYIVAQGIIVGSIAMAGVFEPEIWQLFNGTNGIINADVIKTATIVATMAYAFCAVMLLIIADKIVVKGVDID